MTLQHSKDAAAGAAGKADERDRSGATPRAGGPAAALQSGVGNAAMVQLLRAAGHPWAQEPAEGPAEEPAKPIVQRSAVHEVLRAPGRPMDAATRTDMEQRLGADFSDVRIHDDAAARASAAEVGARAYTSGRHVVLGEGGTDPHTLAHELTHVVQQRHGPVAGTDNGAGLKVSDPSDRFEREAEATATRVMNAPAPDGPVPHTDGDTHAHGADGAVPVARLVTREAFRESTAPFDQRPDPLERLDALLAGFRGVPREQYRARADILQEIHSVAGDPSTGKLKRKRRKAVEALRGAAGEELPIYEKLAAAVAGSDDRVPAGLLDAYEDILRLSRSRPTDHEFGLLAPTVSTELGRRIGGLMTRREEGDGAAREALAALLQADVTSLREMAADPRAAAETRTVLTEVLGRLGIVTLDVGMPGTRKVQVEGQPTAYRMTHALEQPGGQVERLGSLAHELTHVAAGESFRNTAILLLCRRGLTEDQMVGTARARAQDAVRLRGLLTDDMVSPAQRALIEFKIDYLTKSGQLLRYVNGFWGDLTRENEAGAQALKRIATGTHEASAASLVEYDTVLTQLLVYLHSWGVPHAHPFHAEVRRLAAGRHLARTEAAAEHP